MSTGQKTKTLSIFQMLMKFWQTDNIEISRENHLPIRLFHYNYTRARDQEAIARRRNDF
jgi:hypothetical protein